MSRTQVVSEMPGSVITIEKAIGDGVDADEAIVIIEAMKMEIPIVAPKAGRLIELHVGAGDQIVEGQPIAVIEG